VKLAAIMVLIGSSSFLMLRINFFSLKNAEPYLNPYTPVNSSKQILQCQNDESKMSKNLIPDKTVNLTLNQILRCQKSESMRACPFSANESHIPLLKFMKVQDLGFNLKAKECSDMFPSSKYYTFQKDVNNVDFLTYSGCGFEPNIKTDIQFLLETPNLPPVIFYICTDATVLPDKCTGGHLFFVTSLRTYENTVKDPLESTGTIPGYGNGTPCRFFKAPYSVDGAAYDMTKWDERVKSMRDRPLLGYFSGSMYTYPKRKSLSVLATIPRFFIMATDMWGKNEAQRSYYRTQYWNQMSNFIFGLCPRGNGPSSIRLSEMIIVGNLAVLLDDNSVFYGETMCSFFIRASFDDDLVVLAQYLEDLVTDEKKLLQRLENFRNYVTCYISDGHVLSTRFLLYAALLSRKNISENNWIDLYSNILTLSSKH
jgi:hypothetical protein